MTDARLALAPATEQAAAVASGAVSAQELTRLHLDRIERIDPEVGAYLRVDTDGALAAAAAIDEARRTGQPLGPLAGVPIGLKDLLVTRGLETTAASRILRGWIPPYDATVVTRLRDAGAVLLGKLNMDEFAMGSSNENSAVGPCRNPWDRERVPGGSSGGSAAAVAACLCAGALGSDTGGSIRQPASFTGTVGLKPTYGRVSRYGLIAFASSLDQIGPMARTVGDVALLLEVIAGFDARDSTSIDAPVPRYSGALARGVGGLRIGIVEDHGDEGVDPEVASAVAEAVELLGSLGAQVKTVRLPHAHYSLPAYYLIAPAEASSNLARYDGVRYGQRATGAEASLLDMYCKTRGAGFGSEVKRRIMLGTFALRSGYYDAYYKKAQQVRALIKADFDAAFSEVDVIASPTAPTAAFRIGEKADDPVSMYQSDIFTLSCNLAGLPGMSVPCGFTGDGLPIGLQLIGPAMAEETLIAAAAAYEARTDWSRRRPGLAVTGGAA